MLWWCVLIVYCGFRRWRNRVVTPPVESFSLRKEGAWVVAPFSRNQSHPKLLLPHPKKKTPGARNVFCSFSSVLHSQTQRRSQCSACCFPLSAPADPNTFFFCHSRCLIPQFRCHHHISSNPSCLTRPVSHPTSEFPLSAVFQSSLSWGVALSTSSAAFHQILCRSVDLIPCASYTYRLLVTFHSFSSSSSTSA